jgi:hypothetical protein
MSARKLVNVLLTLAVLVAIVGLYRLTPTQKDIQEPLAVNGVVGRAVKTPRFDLTIEGVRVGRTVRASPLPQPTSPKRHPTRLAGARPCPRQQQAAGAQALAACWDVRWFRR